MNRQLSLTPTEAEKFKALAAGEPMWIARAGMCSLCIEGGNDHESYGVGPCAPNLPPLEFVLACAPCETCQDRRLAAEVFTAGDGLPAIRVNGCPDCRIELVGPCPNCGGVGMIAHCGRTDNDSDGPCVLAPHADNFPCYGEGDVASDWSPVSWCGCGVCPCGSRQAWTEEGPCGYCHEQPTRGTVTLGCAYAVGEPLPIVLFGSGHGLVGKYVVVVNQRIFVITNEAFPVDSDEVTAQFAHYDLDTLPGQWAIEVRKA